MKRIESVLSPRAWLRDDSNPPANKEALRIFDHHPQEVFQKPVVLKELR